MRRSGFIGLTMLLGFVCAWGGGSLPQAALAQRAPGTTTPTRKSNPFELRLIRVGKTFQSICLNVITGESWIMADDKFEKVPETGPVPGRRL